MSDKRQMAKTILKGVGIGGGIGAIGGGLTGAVMEGGPGKKVRESKAAYRKRVLKAGLGGAAVGGVLGGIAGGSIGHDVHRYRQAKANYQRAWEEARQRAHGPRGGYEGYQRRHGGGGGGFRPKPPKDPFQAAADKIKDPKVRNRAEAFARMAKQQKGTPEGANAMARLRQHAQKHGFDADELFKHASFMLGVVEAFRD